MEESVWGKRLETCGWMSPKDRELFRKFADDAALRMVGNRRIEKYRTDLSIAHKASNRGIYAMVESLDGLKAAVSAINANHAIMFATKAGCKRTLGSLYNFLHNNDRSLKYAPRELKELIAHRAKPSDRRLAKPVITREEMRELLAFGNTLDRAIISTLYDSGMRVGEFVQLRATDLTPIEEGMEIRVPPGKTGERMVVVVEARTYIQRWLEERPIKTADAPLWTSPETKNVLTGAAIAKRIRMVVERMNEHRAKNGLPLFQKHANPHAFRHARATELGGSSETNEQILILVGVSSPLLAVAK